MEKRKAKKARSRAPKKPPVSKLEKTLKLFARADLRKAAKLGHEEITDTAFGTLLIDYIKTDKLFQITAKVGSKEIALGRFDQKEAERIVSSAYVVFTETA